MNLRAGEEEIVINGKSYSIPANILLFKSPNGKDAYLSSIVRREINSFKSDYTCIVKIIEEEIFQTVPEHILIKYMDNLYRKFYVNKREYDIPYHLVLEAKEMVSKISKYNPIPLREFEKKFEVNLFK